MVKTLAWNATDLRYESGSIHISLAVCMWRSSLNPPYKSDVLFLQLVNKMLIKYKERFLC